MTTKLIKSIGFLSLLASSSFASTIIWGSAGGRGNAFFLSDGVTRVPAGSLVEVGFYAVPTDPTSMFTAFGSTTMGHPGTTVALSIGGHIPSTGRSIVSALSDGNTTYQSKQFALRVYNAPSAAAATQVGIFTGVSFNPGGDFNDGSDSYTMVVGSTATAPLSGISALTPVGYNPGSFRVGGLEVAGGSNPSGAIFSLGAAIPEPTSFTLAGMAVLGLVSRRRRA